MTTPKTLANSIRSIRDLGETESLHTRKGAQDKSDAPYRTLFTVSDEEIVSLAKKTIIENEENPDLCALLLFSDDMIGMGVSISKRFNRPVGKAVFRTKSSEEEKSLYRVHVCIVMTEDGPKVARVTPADDPAVETISLD